METNSLTPESQELIDILDRINVLNIYAIRFYPSQSNPFNVMTKNMKKIVLAIIGKNHKTEFLPNELNDTFERIRKHLPDNLGSERRKIIEDAVERFVNEGGKVEIITRTSRVKREITVFVSFFIIILGTFFILCGGGIIVWTQSKFLFIILLLVYLIYLGFHFLVTKRIQKKLEEETVDLLPDSLGNTVLKNIGDFTGTIIFIQLFSGIIGFFVSLFNPFN